MVWQIQRVPSVSLRHLETNKRDRPRRKSTLHLPTDIVERIIDHVPSLQDHIRLSQSCRLFRKAYLSIGFFRKLSMSLGYSVPDDEYRRQGDVQTYEELAVALQWSFPEISLEAMQSVSAFFLSCSDMLTCTCVSVRRNPASALQSSGHLVAFRSGKRCSLRSLACRA